MDPDANLKEQRDCAANIIGARDGTLAISHDPAEVDRYVSDQADRLAELVQALDEWIMRGGCLPGPWAVAVHRSINA